MLEALILTAEAAKEAATAPPPLWQFFGGPAVGAALATGAMALIHNLADKKVTPAVTVQSKTQALLEGLERMVTLMTEDKAKDAERIAALQNRIDELELDSQKDLEAISKLHREILELHAEASRKDATIRLLANELSVLGVLAHGLDESVHTTVTFERKDNEPNV